MKGGGSIQLALLDRYGEEEFTGNLVVLGLPDEENLSAGMRAAVKLLSALKREHRLNYVLMINSEPHQRRTPDRGVLSTGLRLRFITNVASHAKMWRVPSA